MVFVVAATMPMRRGPFSRNWKEIFKKKENDLVAIA
jgi:hypothetical protein